MSFGAKEKGYRGPGFPPKAGNLQVDEKECHDTQILAGLPQKQWGSGGV